MLQKEEVNIEFWKEENSGKESVEVFKRHTIK